MGISADQQRVKALLTETIMLLCKNGLHFKNEFTVEGLIGITIDKEEVFLVNIKETIKVDPSFQTNIKRHTNKKRKHLTCEKALSNDIYKSQNLENVSTSDFQINQNNPAEFSSSFCTSRDNSDLNLGLSNGSSEPKSPQITSLNVSNEVLTELLNEVTMETTKSFMAHNNINSPSQAPSDLSNPLSQDLNTSLISSPSFSFASPNSHEDSKVNLQIISSSVAINNHQSTFKSSTNSHHLESYNHKKQNIRIKEEKSENEMFRSTLSFCSDNHPLPLHHSSPKSLVKNSTPYFLPEEQDQKVELLPGSGVFVSLRAYSFLTSETWSRGSKLVRRVVREVFPDEHILARSSCLGKRLGGCHVGLDHHKVDTIKAFVQQKMPQVSHTEVVAAINECCRDIRAKLRKSHFRNNKLNQSMTHLKPI